LTMRSLVHRDLAARNILICEGGIAKISDFGNSAHNTSIDMHPIRTSVKWAAPEVIFDTTYTTKSDIWSYGVVLFEIFTYGSVPYPNLSSLEEVKLVIRNKSSPLKCPDTSPPEIQELMNKCLQYEPSLRPDFDTIAETLKTLEHTLIGLEEQVPGEYREQENS